MKTIKKVTSIFLVLTMVLGIGSIASAAGFRTSIQHDITTAPKIVGGQASFKIPTSMNDVYNSETSRIHPEYFIKLYSNTQDIGFDGGIIKYNGQWYWFLYSDNYVKDIWQHGIGGTPLNISGGDVVNIKFTGEKVWVSTKYEYHLVLYVNGVEQVRLKEKDWGWHVGNVYYEGVHNVGYEANMVPNYEISGTRYHTVSDAQGRAYFNGVEITNALPITYTGSTTTTGYTWRTQVDCDDSQYTQSEVDTATDYVSNTHYLWSIIDFTRLP